MRGCIFGVYGFFPLSLSNFTLLRKFNCVFLSKNNFNQSLAGLLFLNPLYFWLLLPIISTNVLIRSRRQSRSIGVAFLWNSIVASKIICHSLGVSLCRLSRPWIADNVAFGVALFLKDRWRMEYDTLYFLARSRMVSAKFGWMLSRVTFSLRNC